MDCSTFLLPCRGGIYAARGLALTAPLTVHTVGRGLDPSAALCGCRIVARNVYMPPGAVSVARNLPGAVKTAPYKPF